MKKNVFFIIVSFLIIISCHKDKLQGPSIPPMPPGPDFRLKFIGHYDFVRYDNNHPNPIEYNYDTTYYHSKIEINPATSNTIFIYYSDTTNYFETKIDTNGVMEAKTTSVSATSTYFGGNFIGIDSVHYCNSYYDGHYGLYSYSNIYGRKTSI